MYAAAVEPPTNFTAVDMGANSVNLTWTIGVGATNTTIVCKREEAPTSRTDGETVYIANGTAYIHTGLALETTKYYYAAWGWDSINGYSATTTEVNVGGEGMEALSESVTGLSTNIELIGSVIFNLVFLIIVLWRREMFLYIIAGPVAMAFGFYWAQTYLIAGISFAIVGGYCWYLALMTWIRSR